MAKRYFPRQELAARGLSPMVIAALERAYQLSDEQVGEVAEIVERLAAQEAASTARFAAELAGVEAELRQLVGLIAPGPSYADISALQAQIDDLMILARPPEAGSEPDQDLMYPPSYS